MADPANDSDLEQLRALVERMAPRPVAKARDASGRARHRSNVHAAFCAAIDELELSGWSRRQIAAHMEVDPVTLKDWYEAGDTQRSQLPYWVKSALPLQGRVAMTRQELGWSEPPPAGRTGTGG
jgi:hypothetical protein